MARAKTATEYPTRGRDPERAPTHPGEILRETVLPALGLSVSAAAAALGVTRQTLHEVLAERRAVSVDMALRLGKLCGNGPTLWINLQTARDLWERGRALAAELERIETRAPKAA